MMISCVNMFVFMSDYVYIVGCHIDLNVMRDI